MPTGVIINVICVVLGGISGTLIGNHLSDNFKFKLNLIFAVCSFTMGINGLIVMQNLPAVILALVLGTMIGIILKFELLIQQLGKYFQKIVSRFIPSSTTQINETQFLNALTVVFVLFCASGTGIYGTLVSGMTNDHSILIAKSILDFFTATIFAANIGPIVSLIAFPQILIMMGLFFLANIILPLASPAMINDFKACGGAIIIATGFRIAKIENFPVADMIPAMILIMPFSYLWTNYIIPLIS